MKTCFIFVIIAIFSMGILAFIGFFDITHVDVKIMNEFYVKCITLIILACLALVGVSSLEVEYGDKFKLSFKGHVKK